MEYKTFKTEVEELLKSNDILSEFELYMYGFKNSTKDKIAVFWETGGVSGGSCWDSHDPEPYTTSEPEGELKSLDYIIEHYKEDMSFIQYRKIYNKLVEIDTYTDYEYYGNRTDYSYKMFDLKELFEYFTNKEWLK